MGALRNTLIRDTLELARGPNKLFADLVGKFKRGNKVADTEPKAHCYAALSTLSVDGRRCTWMGIREKVWAPDGKGITPLCLGKYEGPAVPVPPHRS
jgi:hypothetical protein